MANRKLVHLLVVLLILENCLTTSWAASLEKTQQEPRPSSASPQPHLDASVMFRAKELAGKQFQKIIQAYFSWNRNNSINMAPTTTKNPYDKEGLRF